jgi:CDP-glycerol glycerophosphotransferase (TagB/SpsB family)
MISDFSGIIFDYMFLRNRPVIYACEEMDLRPYDSHLIYNNQDEMFTFQVLNKAGVKLTQDLFPNLPDIIQKTINDNDILSSIAAAKNEVWRYQGEAGKRVVDYMINTVGYL